MKTLNNAFLQAASHEDGYRLGKLISRPKALPDAMRADLVALHLVQDGVSQPDLLGGLRPSPDFLEGLSTGLARMVVREQRRSESIKAAHAAKDDWGTPPTAAERNPAAYARAKELRDKGETLKFIAETLHKEGLRSTAKGEPITASGVRRLLGLIRGGTSAPPAKWAR